MCNVSQGIKEKAFDAGITQGKLDAHLELLREGLITISTAAQKLGISENEVKKFIK